VTTALEELEAYTIALARSILAERGASRGETPQTNGVA